MAQLLSDGAPQGLVPAPHGDRRAPPGRAQGSAVAVWESEARGEQVVGYLRLPFPQTRKSPSRAPGWPPATAMSPALAVCAPHWTVP